MSTKDNLLSGVFYTAIAKYSGIIISLVVTAILARLILPKDFGIIAIASIFMNFFSTLTTVGIAPAIVQNKTLTEKDLKSINSFTVQLSIVLTILFVLCVPLITQYYDNNSLLKTILYILSLSITLSVATIVPNALLMKEKHFKFIAMRSFWIQLSMGVVSCIGAYIGMGIYALLINPIIGNMLLLIVNYMKKPIAVCIRWSPMSIKKILSFSVYQMLFNLVYLLYRNVDKIFIGKYMKMDTLGYYEKSYRLMLLPLENVSTVINPVLHPILSDFQNSPQYLWNAYLKMLRLLSEIGFYISVVLYFGASSIIRIIYGDAWEPAIPMFQALSLSVCFQIMQAPIGAVLQSINKVKGLLFSSIIVLIAVLLSVLISICLNNIILFCYLLTLSFLIGFFVYQYFIIHYLKTKYIEIFVTILKPFLTNLFLFLLLYSINQFLYNDSSIFVFCIYMLSVFAYEMLMIYLGYAPELKELLSNIKKYGVR